MRGIEKLKARLRDVHDLNSATELLQWDQETHMPPGGAAARSRQIGILSRLAHEYFTAGETGRLLDAAALEVEGLEYDSDGASLVRVARRQWELAVRRPVGLVAEFQEHLARSYQAWITARQKNDFSIVQPFLERTLALSIRTAECYPGYDHIADPLIDFADYGMKASSVRVLFRRLREQLLPIVKEVVSHQPADDSSLRRPVAADSQLAFGLEVIRRIGFDEGRGRQDLAPHPFTTKLSLGDVRITTRVRDDDFTDAFFSTLHECGHALYEQGLAPELEATPLAHGASSGVHESQSRLWENVVGRSRDFWEFHFPRLQAVFGPGVADLSLDMFHSAINRVRRTPVRLDADEFTYNLHIMLRFDLELDLLEGALDVRDLPSAWNERSEADLGVAAPDPVRGVLQDSHWFDGPIGGAFQGYTLGNLMSAQFFQSAVQTHPSIPADMRRGDFSLLLGWLRENVHRHGAKFSASELLRRATGQGLEIEPYVDYLRGKALSRCVGSELRHGTPRAEWSER